MNFKQYAYSELIFPFENIMGRFPTKIHIPSKVEVMMQNAPETVVGNLYERLKDENVREVFPKFLGLEPIWDATEFRVE